MITNFKIFESNKNKKFWLIENDKNIKVSLSYIGIGDELIDNFINNLHKSFDTDKYYYVGLDSNGTWSYGKYLYSLQLSYYYKHNYNYMGQVRLTQEEIGDYQTRKNADKYNL